METGETEKIGIPEIDEALSYSCQSRLNPQFNRKIIDEFIDELLDQRIEATK